MQTTTTDQHETPHTEAERLRAEIDLANRLAYFRATGHFPDRGEGARRNEQARKEGKA